MRYSTTTASLSSSTMSIPEEKSGMMECREDNEGHQEHQQQQQQPQDMDHLLDELLSDDDEAFNALVKYAVQHTLDHQTDLNYSPDFQDDISLAVFLEGETVVRKDRLCRLAPGAQCCDDSDFSAVYADADSYYNDVDDYVDYAKTRHEDSVGSIYYDNDVDYDAIASKKQQGRFRRMKWSKIMKRMSPLLKAAHLR